MIDTFEQQGLLLINQLLEKCSDESDEARTKLVSAQQTLGLELSRLAGELEADQVQLQIISASNDEAIEQTRLHFVDQVKALDALIEELG